MLIAGWIILSFIIAFVGREKKVGYWGTFIFSLLMTTDQQRPGALRFYQQLGFVNSHNGMKLHL